VKGRQGSSDIWLVTHKQSGQKFVVESEPGREGLDLLLKLMVLGPKPRRPNRRDRVVSIETLRELSEGTQRDRASACSLAQLLRQDPAHEAQHLEHLHGSANGFRAAQFRHELLGAPEPKKSNYLNMTYAAGFMKRKHYYEQLDIATGEVIATYNSVKQIHEATDLTDRLIRACIRGELRSCGGYHWAMRTRSALDLR